jgi:hypothetical protein
MLPSCAGFNQILNLAKLGANVKNGKPMGTLTQGINQACG